MVAWDDWEGMLKDGAKVFGIRIIYSIPILILLFPLFISMFVMPVLLSTSSGSEMEVFIPIFMLIFFGVMCVMIPISIPIAVVIPAAEMYVADTDEFAAGFRIRDWWAILRTNISGFIAAFAIYYVSSMVLGLAIQIVGMTMIFACLLPFLLPAITMYSLLIMYTTIAQAYKVGKDKLASNKTAEAQLAA